MDGGVCSASRAWQNRPLSWRRCWGSKQLEAVVKYQRCAELRDREPSPRRMATLFRTALLPSPPQWTERVGHPPAVMALNANLRDLAPGVVEILNSHAIIFALPAPIFPQECEI